MIQIPDAAVQAFRQSFESTDNNCETYQDVRKALTAALPHLPLGFEVKQLEWVKHPTASLWRAETVFGVYQVWSREMSGWLFDGNSGEKVSSENTSSMPEAKAAAQADFERRVLDCIDADINEVSITKSSGCVFEYLGVDEAAVLEKEELAIDELRLKAFRANSEEDRQAYFDAVSKWFQNRHSRALSRKLVDVTYVYRQALEEAERVVGSTVLKHIASDYDGMTSLEAYEAGQMNGMTCALDAIRALSAEPAQGERWQPIETAPKDGTDVLLKRTMGRPEIVGGYFDGAWRSFDQPDKEIADVTHWMPLPAAPTSEAGR